MLVFRFVLERASCLLRKKPLSHLSQSFLSSVSDKRKTACGVVQFCSVHDKEKNLQTCSDLIDKCCVDGAQMVCLPETFDVMSRDSKESVEAGEEIAQSRIIHSYREIAAKKNIWLSLGGFHESRDVGDDGPKKIYNTHIMIDPSGTIQDVYRKIHLFDISWPVSIKESATTVAGSSTKVVPTPLGNIGLSICFDIRFPELYNSLRRQGADIILIPAAFMQKTGVHWHTLVRARAIETQTYVVAAATYGRHNQKRESFGHSLIISPYGETLLDLGKQEPVHGVAELDFSQLKKVRQAMPVSRMDQHILMMVLFSMRHLNEKGTVVSNTQTQSKARMGQSKVTSRQQ
jgi:deaminated glutathione amidase